MNLLLDSIQSHERIALCGHIRPDGDCIGANMGLYEYITDNYPDKKVSVLLNQDEIPDSFDYLKKEKAFCHQDSYDLFISLDCGDKERLGDASEIFDLTTDTVNIDHHISNTQFAKQNWVKADYSSTCEVLYTLMDTEKISKACAQALYTGIIHDTGVLKHSNTSKQTMEIAGDLMDRGIPYSKIIDDSFYMKTYTQLQIMGRCLLESVRVMNGKIIFSLITQKMMEFYGAKSSDLDGIIDELRTTKGVEVAILLHETDVNEYKVSMRSNNDIDVSKICVFFGGGGHVKAAGCKIKGSAHDVMNNITGHIEHQLKKIDGI